MLSSKRLLVAAAVIAPVLALVYCASFADAQRFAPGYCPTIVAQENFDKTRFFGNWIEVEKTPSIFDLMMRCLVVDYSDDQDNTVNVVVRGISLAGLPLTVNGDGLLQDVHRSGFYSIRYGFGVPFQGTLTTILDTDYDDYAVVYSCTNSLLSGVFHSEYIWVLSRSGKISNPTRQNIYEKLDKLQINRSGLTMSDRSTCPTNSSTVARESDKDLAGQPVLGANAQSTITASAASSDAAAAAASPMSGSSSSSSSSSSSASSSPASGSDKQASDSSADQTKLEPTQKSVVVPLLYDPPTQAAPPKSSILKSSVSAGAPSSPDQSKAIASNAISASKPQPVANKPLVVQQAAPAQQAAAVVKPIAVSQQQQPQQASPTASLSQQVPAVKPIAPVSQAIPSAQSLPRASRR